MHRPALAIVALFLNAASAAADIGPKPTTSGRNPGPSATDVAGVEVEINEERVDLLVRPVASGHDKLEVHADFTMVNDGDTATFETGFPIGPFRNYDSFSVKVDGKAIDFDVVDRGAKSASGDATKRGRAGANSDWWYVWQATFPGHATSRHVVDYVLDLAWHNHTRTAGYVLHTGAGWKGPIGRAVVTLRFTDGLTLDHLMEIEPKTGGARRDDHLEWTRTAFEPTGQDDIRVVYSDTSASELIASAREEARTTWAGRARLALLLRRVPDQWLRERMTEDELAHYLDALAAIIAEQRADGDRILLPAGSNADRRDYVGNPDALLRWLDAAADVVEKQPESARAREVLALYVKLCETFLADRLVAGDETLAYAWRGNTDTPERIAARDASIAKRRAVAASWLERGRRLLKDH